MVIEGQQGNRDVVADGVHLPQIVFIGMAANGDNGWPHDVGGALHRSNSDVVTVNCRAYRDRPLIRQRPHENDTIDYFPRG